MENITESEEKFSLKLFNIVLFMHILALPSFMYITKENIISFGICHTLFATFGLSLGYHRFFSHRSFKAVRPLEIVLGFFAILCFQGGPIFWAAGHRSHHRNNESLGDPHSAKRGFFWSHIGWMFYTNPNGYNYLKSLRTVTDLRNDKFFYFLEKNSTKINIVALSLLAITCLIFNRIDLFFWLGPMRIVSVWHCTWLINSYAHSAWNAPSSPTSKIKDSLWHSFVLGGEGDHKYHHDYPSNPLHSKRTIHFDFGFYILFCFKKLGLVSYKTRQYKILQVSEDDLDQSNSA